MRTIPVSSHLLRPLSNLTQLHVPNLGYQRSQRYSADPYIATGAWCALLEAKSPPASYQDELVQASRYGAVRNRAFSMANAGFERDLELTISQVKVESVDAIRNRKMLAQLAVDAKAGEEASGDLYLATGELDHIMDASRQAEEHGGWRAALPWAVRMAAIAPLDPRGWARLYLLLNSANQSELLHEVADVMVAANLYPQLATIFTAAALFKQGNPKGCLDRLAPLTDARVLDDRILAPTIGFIRGLRAVSEDALGHFQAAYAHYQALNTKRSSVFDPKQIYRNAETRDRLRVPPLRTPERTNVTQMLGFPRSGTTLLENVLAAHPEIETFEEIPAVTAAYGQIERILRGLAPRPEDPALMYENARAKYYEQIDLRRKRPTASTLVDKMPLRSMEVDFLSKLFPEWRYIFSIRHPYDVVWSCFRQSFTPNVAMENFHTIEDTVRLYDYTMTRWFDYFTLSEPRVAYVRYDELVTNFEPTVRRILDFLDIKWDDAVLDFATASHSRTARTPSYLKVRQGLSIGVQSNWRNYDFIFDSDVARPLTKWVEFFGYEGL